MHSFRSQGIPVENVDEFLHVAASTPFFFEAHVAEPPSQLRLGGGVIHQRRSPQRKAGLAHDGTLAGLGAWSAAAGTAG